MIKIILFDCDGVIVKKHRRFSQILLSEFGITREQTDSFYKWVFLDCEKGRADLKAELPKFLKEWQWRGSIDDFMKIWFEMENELDEEMVNAIKNFRVFGTKCYLSTNNEKYRTEYLTNIVGLKIFLDGVFSSCYLGFLKPQLEFWHEIYKNFPEVQKEQILVWDDAQSAIDSAKEFGLNAEFYNDFSSFKKVMEEKYQLKVE